MRAVCILWCGINWVTVKMLLVCVCPTASHGLLAGWHMTSVRKHMYLFRVCLELLYECGSRCCCHKERMEKEVHIASYSVFVEWAPMTYPRSTSTNLVLSMMQLMGNHVVCSSGVINRSERNGSKRARNWSLLNIILLFTVPILISYIFYVPVYV